MRQTAWIWFLGCAAWLADGLVNAHYRLWPHAKLAFTVALFFMAAGLFYSQQKKR